MLFKSTDKNRIIDQKNVLLVVENVVLVVAGVVALFGANVVVLRICWTSFWGWLQILAIPTIISAPTKILTKFESLSVGFWVWVETVAVDLSGVWVETLNLTGGGNGDGNDGDLMSLIYHYYSNKYL